MTEGLPDLAEKERFYRERAPLPRVGSPEDVAGLAVFLLGPEAAWITGQSIPVDGGYTIQ
jgi:3-oxoacyl-[acyl-carrier protein] reductase